VADLDIIEENAEEMATGMDNIKVLLKEPSSRRIVKERINILQSAKDAA
jgi:hypothetical protein